jgi:hypothetical protein
VAAAGEAAAAEAAAEKEAEEAEAADGASVRKPERRSVPAAARPALPAQPLGPVVALRVGESTGPAAPSGPVARERRFGWDPDQAQPRAGVPAPRRGVGSSRRRRRRPPGGTPRSCAPSVSCLPLSRLVRHRVISPSAAARGLGTFDVIPACAALQSLVRVVRRGCRYLGSGGVLPLLSRAAPFRVLEVKQIFQ